MSFLHLELALLSVMANATYITGFEDVIDFSQRKLRFRESWVHFAFIFFLCHFLQSGFSKVFQNFIQVFSVYFLSKINVFFFTKSVLILLTRSPCTTLILTIFPFTPVAQLWPTKFLWFFRFDAGFCRFLGEIVEKP